MLYLIGGENNYESSRRVGELKSDFLKSNTDARIIVKNADEENASSDVFLDLTGMSFFSEAKVFIIKRAFKNKDKTFLHKLEILISGNWKSLNLIFWEDGKLDKRLKISKTIAKLGVVEEFEPLKPYQLKSWLIKYIKSKDLNIKPDLVDELILRCGTNQMVLCGVIENLYLSLKSQQSNIITQKDIIELAPKTTESTIWDLIDALSAQETYNSMTIIEEIVSDQSSFALTISMINRQLRILTEVKLMQNERYPYDTIQKKLKLHPFVMQKIAKSVNYFTLDKLKVLYKKLFDADMAVKSGKFTPKLALDLFLSVV